MNLFKKVLCYSTLIVPIAVSASELPQATSKWYKDADAMMRRVMAQAPNLNKAKNVILMVADGNGVTSVFATRIFEGQKFGKSGEGHELPYEKFPYLALAKTYNSNAQSPDSAGTAAAMVAGVKTRQGVVGVDENLERTDCNGVPKHSLPSIHHIAKDRGYATGVVSTARVTHATPSSVYSSTADRNYEDNSKLPKDCTGQKDIAAQLIDSSLDLAMGGGRRHFIPKNFTDQEGKSGKRTDGKNLIDAWKKAVGQYAWDDKTHASLDLRGSKILGLYESSHMKYEHDRTGEPSLAEMTKTAIEYLSAKSERGFFLMVEAGRVDHANHANNAHRMVTDGVAFAEAVRIADEMTDDEETLIIVTADHSHALAIAGYTKLGTPILGLCYSLDKKGNPTDKLCLGADGKPYTMLSYGNGASSILKKDADGNYTSPKGRPTVTQAEALDPDYLQEAAIPRSSETHGAEDVAIYAKGPWAHLFQGTVEQNYIFHVMKQAFQF